MKQIKLAIFDLDGTLVDTLKDLAVSTNVVLEKYNYPTHEIDAYRRFVGDGLYKLVERALPEEARIEAIIEKVMQGFLAYYDEHLTDYAKPYDGIVDVLIEMKDRGIKLAIATNKPHPQAVKLVEACFGAIPFTHIIGNQEGRPHKPDPWCVNTIIEENHLGKDEVIYIGDSDVDMQTAQASGVYGIGVSWGFRGRPELMASGADRVVDNAVELLKVLE